MDLIVIDIMYKLRNDFANNLVPFWIVQEHFEIDPQISSYWCDFGCPFQCIWVRGGSNGQNSGFRVYITPTFQEECFKILHSQREGKPVVKVFDIIFI